MARSKYIYRKLIETQLDGVRGKRGGKRRGKSLTPQDMLLLQQPLYLLNYVEPPESWLRADDSVWKKNIKLLCDTLEEEEFKELVIKTVRLVANRKAVWNYMRAW